VWDLAWEDKFNPSTDELVSSNFISWYELIISCHCSNTLGVPFAPAGIPSEGKGKREIFKRYVWYLS